MKHVARDIQVLLVDDDGAFREVLAEELGRSGFGMTTAPNSERALAELERCAFDVAIVDLNLPGMPGEELIREMRDRSPSTEIVVLTGNATVENAVRTLKDGAYDFIKKPCSLDELEAVLHKANEKRYLVRENNLLHRELARHDRFKEFVGSSRALQAIVEIIEKLSDTDSTVLIQGESGVGKELAAKAVHRTSPRSRQPFIVVDCTSLQETLLQSELFGHERGAFTGAIARKHGLFEVADGGTLFLDEIGEITQSLQARILRVLDAGTFRRVGGVQDIRVNVRVICATNRDLQAMVKDGEFRMDLFYRINVVSFTMPPLRERRQDIPLLADYFASHSPVARNRRAEFAPEAMAALQNYDWPGNVRELQNVIERALILSSSALVTLDDLPGNLRHEHPTDLDALTAHDPSLAQLERAYIGRLLDQHRGHRARVAQILGISERTLYRKLRGLQDPVRRT